MNLPNYIYGTTRLGDESISFEDRVSIAISAMERTTWFHTSDQYGDALTVLRTAFEQSPARIPNLIFKIGWESVEQIRGQVLSQLEAVGLKKLQIGQLCLGGKLAEAFREGDPLFRELLKLKEEGLVENFVLETWPWNSAIPFGALKNGHARDLLDGYIFYFNPLQRFVSNELWDLLRERNESIIAMRTVAGGPVTKWIDNSKAPEYLARRAAEVKPVFNRSGCESWTEFCVRYVFGVSQVRATVGSTSHVASLDQFVAAAKDPAPLPGEIQAEIEGLQRAWADDHDAHAPEWSM